MNVREVLDRNGGIGPGFHLLRHVLAFAIVLWHCRQAIWWSDSARSLAAAGVVANGLSRASAFNLEDIVRPAVHALVGMFFALSGFLVAGSALRTKLTGRFLLNRALRIFPALGVETLLSALILGPAVTTLGLAAYFTNPEFFRYFGNIVGWVHFTLPGVFPSNPLPRIVNGQLWTLQPEFWCYLLMALAMSLGFIGRRTLVLALCGVVLLVATGLYLYDPVTFDAKGENFFKPWYITLLFWCGVTYFLYADTIPLRMTYAALAVLAYWAMIFFSILTPLAGIPLTYLMVFIGMTAFPWWDRLAASDYSYGVFLYHFPIIQTIMWLLHPTAFGEFSHSLQCVILFPLALTLSIGFARLSWRFVEKPALLLRTSFARTTSVTGELTPAAIEGHGAIVTPDEQAEPSPAIPPTMPLARTD